MRCPRFPMCLEDVLVAVWMWPWGCGCGHGDVAVWQQPWGCGHGDMGVAVRMWPWGCGSVDVAVAVWMWQCGSSHGDVPMGMWQCQCGTLLPKPTFGCPSQCLMAGWVWPFPSNCAECMLQGAGCWAQGAVLRVLGAGRWVLFGNLAVGMFVHRALGFRGNAASPRQAWQLSVSYSLLSSVGSGKINLIASLHP